MSPYRRTWRGLAAAAALVAAACSDSAGPQPELSDPQQLSTDLQSVSTVFTSPAFQSFGALGTTTGSPLAAPSPAGALLAATPITPPRGSRQAYANAPRRLQALRMAAGATGSGINATVIPPAQRGQTFVWDDAAHQYVVSPDPGPSSGIRIILYAIDPLTQAIVEPSTAVGFVDLLDESTPTPPVHRLHVIVSGGTPASPGTVYVDYTVSGSVTGNPVTRFDASANGFVSDGTHTLTFSATFSATNLETDNPDGAVLVTWDLNSPAVRVVLDETLTTPNANELTLTINEFSVQHGDETVSVRGSIVVVSSGQTETVTVNLTIFVGGSQYATITGTITFTPTGTTNNIEFQRRDGKGPSPAEIAALADLFDLPEQLEEAVFSLFHPCERLMGG